MKRISHFLQLKSRPLQVFMDDVAAIAMRRAESVLIYYFDAVLSIPVPRTAYGGMLIGR